MVQSEKREWEAKQQFFSWYFSVVRQMFLMWGFYDAIRFGISQLFQKLMHQSRWGKLMQWVCIYFWSNRWTGQVCLIKLLRHNLLLCNVTQTHLFTFLLIGVTMQTQTSGSSSNQPLSIKSSFENLGSSLHLKIQNYTDLKAILELDEALWIATTAPVSTLKIDTDFLNFLDTDEAYQGSGGSFHLSPRPYLAGFLY